MKVYPIVTARASLIALLFLVFLALVVSGLSSRTEQATKTGYSSWYWGAIQELPDLEKEELFRRASSAGIDTIYLSINDYADLFELTNSNDKISKINNYKAHISKTIKIASENNISVHALIGNTDWAQSSHWYIPEALVRFVLEFNLDNPDTIFEGIQYDIEQYSLPNYQTNKQTIDNEYFSLLHRTQKILEDTKLSFGVIVTHWNEDATEKTIEILNNFRLPYLAVLAYSDHADGDKGSIALSTHEAVLVEKTGRVKLVIGQETGKLKNDELSQTFFDESMDTFKLEVEKLELHYRGKSFFETIAVHDLESYLKMLY